MESLLKPPEFARDLLSDHTDMDRSPHRISDADRAGIAVSLPDDAYFEYVWRDGAGKLHEDPQNPKSAQSIWYGRVSVIEGPEYRAHPVATASMETEPGGELRRERMVSEALQQTRRVNTYTPAGFQGAELPAILVQDGTAFHRLGRLASALDAVMDAGARPARLVFLEPVEREREYAFDRSYQHFGLDELMPRLAERRHQQGGTLSGGEQQMLAVGRALVGGPQLLLLDEPSMGLAPQLVEQIFEIVKRINEESGVSILLAEQNTNIALKYARYGYILENGRVVMDGEAAALREALERVLTDVVLATDDYRAMLRRSAEVEEYLQELAEEGDHTAGTARITLQVAGENVEGVKEEVWIELHSE